MSVTPAGDNVLLTYDNRIFTLVTRGSSVDIFGIHHSNYQWQELPEQLSISHFYHTQFIVPVSLIPSCSDDGIVGCPFSPYFNDDYCDDELNNVDCDYDGGDCCLSDTNKDYCSDCICYGQEVCKAGIIPSSVGDGICHDETNNHDCNYDGGDCCLFNTNTHQCSTCTCFHKENCASGFLPLIIGDGICHDETNNEDCNYDGGDCCLFSINRDYCIDCICFHQEMCSAGSHPLVDNGFCNDETNNEACNYDGGDCCKLPVKKDHCSDCECSKLEPFY